MDPGQVELRTPAWQQHVRGHVEADGVVCHSILEILGFHMFHYHPLFIFHVMIPFCGIWDLQQYYYILL